MTTITRYIYDNEDILLELDTQNSILARYTHGPGIDEPLVMEKGGASFFYHADGLGSITELSDSLGVVKQRYSYSSFGKIESQLDSNFVQPYTFTSREFDEETGLFYYRARYYDPTPGRFVGQDPKFKANLYRYAGNNPTKFKDPFGTIDSSDICAAIAALIERFQDLLRFKLRSCENPFTDPDVKTLRGDIKELQKIYDKYCRGGGGDDPERRPEVPEKFVDQVNQLAEQIEWWRRLGKAAFGATAGYGLYRGLRLLPSLIPPLWPTLPANVVAP